MSAQSNNKAGTLHREASPEGEQLSGSGRSAQLFHCEQGKEVLPARFRAVTRPDCRALFRLLRETYSRRNHRLAITASPHRLPASLRDCVDGPEWTNIAKNKQKYHVTRTRYALRATRLHYQVHQAPYQAMQASCHQEDMRYGARSGTAGPTRGGSEAGKVVAYSSRAARSSSLIVVSNSCSRRFFFSAVFQQERCAHR